MKCIETGKKLVSPFIEIREVDEYGVYLNSKPFKSCKRYIIKDDYLLGSGLSNYYEHKEVYKVQTVLVSGSRADERILIGYLPRIIVKERLPRTYEALEKLRVELGSGLENIFEK